ncbi:MAG TPA: HD domain-containing phosphohydrolase [Thermoanaerobaculia bacterium]|nr:HD domain-containing phosphohydrolase [Thermoanaerobaculia bacterium]
MKRITIDELALHSGDSGTGQLGPNEVMYVWFQLFKTAQIHAIDNQALNRPIQAMCDLSARIVSQEGRMSLQSRDRALFVNGQKLKLSDDEYELAFDVFDFFEQRGMGGFVADGALSDADVRTMLAILIYAPQAERTFAKIDAALRSASIPFRINKVITGATRSEAELVMERRSSVFTAYAKLVVLLQELMNDEKLNASRHAFLLKKIARVVHALVDLCIEDDQTFVTVACVKSVDVYEPHHAANSAVLAIALGKKVGMRKRDLADLGLAAAFHDVGMRSCPTEIVEKREPLDANERALVDQHTIASVELLLRERKYTKATLSRIVVAFEHHRPNTPPTPSARRPDLFSRIVEIAAIYDALTTYRPWRKAYRPDQTLTIMLRDGGKKFDPALMRLFVGALGMHPVGTLVKLDSGEGAVVVRGRGPIVALLDREGHPAKTIDLGDDRRSIVSSEDPVRFRLQPSGLVAASAVAE